MSYHQRDVVWVRFPFTDGTSTKRRPALVLSNETVNQTGDLILLQITSKNHEDNLTHPLDSSDYEEGEFSIKSYLRIHKIFILNEELINRQSYQSIF